MQLARGTEQKLPYKKIICLSSVTSEQAEYNSRGRDQDALAVFNTVV